MVACITYPQRMLVQRARTINVQSQVHLNLISMPANPYSCSQATKAYYNGECRVHVVYGFMTHSTPLHRHPRTQPDCSSSTSAFFKRSAFAGDCWRLQEIAENLLEIGVGCRPKGWYGDTHILCFCQAHSDCWSICVNCWSFFTSAGALLATSITTKLSSKQSNQIKLKTKQWLQQPGCTLPMLFLSNCGLCNWDRQPVELIVSGATWQSYRAYYATLQQEYVIHMTLKTAYVSAAGVA